MPDAHVTVVKVSWHGSEVVTLTYWEGDGAVAEKLLFREHEAQLPLVAEGRPWSFGGDGEVIRLASEAKRISLAYEFDPYVAISTSLVKPLPHQIPAVYREMLDRQRLSFLLFTQTLEDAAASAKYPIRDLAAQGEIVDVAS